MCMMNSRRVAGFLLDKDHFPTHSSTGRNTPHAHEVAPRVDGKQRKLL